MNRLDSNRTAVVKGMWHCYTKVNNGKLLTMKMMDKSAGHIGH